MAGCKQREVAAAVQGDGAAPGEDGGFQDSGRSPSFPGTLVLSHPASWWRCSGEDGQRAEIGAGTVAVGSSVATKTEEWTVPCPKVCQPFLFCLFPP